jgi:hypothetical protein
MALYTSVSSQLMPFSASVSDSVKMSDFASVDSSDIVQKCLPRSTFSNLPASCLAVVVYVDLPKKFDYSNNSRSFGCSVCEHGYFLDSTGLCQQVSNCDASYSNKNYFFNGCGSCASGYSLTFFNNNGNSISVNFSDNDSGNSDLDNRTTLANRYLNQWIYNHHDLSASPPRDIYNSAFGNSNTEVDYTSCHDISSEPADQSNCHIYDFINKKCSLCKPGFIRDQFGTCHDQGLPFGCNGLKDNAPDFILSLDSNWESVDKTSTANDVSRVVVNDLQALAFYSNVGQTCSACDLGWKQIHVFSEDVGRKL